MNELAKSIKAVLYDRIKSPLSGTLFLSWLVWNWKIIFLILFVSENKITETKTDYIIKHYNNHLHLIWGPIISTFILITLFPIFSFGTYWLSLHFKNHF